MTKPVKLRPKVEALDAIQFTGGESDAKTIDEFLDAALTAVSRRGAYAVQYVPAVEEPTAEDENVTQVSEDEYLAIFTLNGRQRIEPGMWIVLDANAGFRVHSPEQIATDFTVDKA